MAVRRRADGRWAVYYRIGGKLRWEYFGHGAEGEAAAWKRQEELHLAKRRPPREDYGPAFAEIAKSYMRGRGFAPGPLEQLGVRLGANLLPHFGAMPAVRIRDKDRLDLARLAQTAGEIEAALRILEA